MALTGQADGPAQMCAVPLASQADGLIAALNYLSPNAALRGIDGAQLLGERAAMTGHLRRGATSPGGACRLLRAADGWLAVNLPRPSDWELAPAWLEREAASGWDDVAQAVKQHSAHDCVARGRLLGLAVAAMTPLEQPPSPWVREMHRTPAAPFRPPPRIPLVIDLSSLWAGPLCTQLLQTLGARVVKVESTTRPDGMRQGEGAFYNLLNHGKASVALDFATARGREQLRRLLLQADIVIEASRPRALRQLNVIAEDILDENPYATWIGISGHGRDEPAANWIAFGDDAGVAGGLSQALQHSSGEAMFCADAIADPLTGLHAALAAWSSFQQGGGRLLSIAMSDVVAHCVQFNDPGDSEAMRERAADWRARITDHVAAPRHRPIVGQAAGLGDQTMEVLSALDIPC
ncbi:MAG: CoA transferase [Polaromonas sp.]|nr:CoA transferase [Polaromonas sp.]